MTAVLRFVRRQLEAGDVESFLFEPQSPLRFTAGQYLSLALPHVPADDRGAERCFTIASAPSEPLAQITTRMSAPPSSFKSALRALVPGALVDAEGPYGDFVLHDDDRPAVLIAGGIGITPFRSMLAELAATRRQRDVTLLYSNAVPEFPFRAFLDGLGQEWPTLRLVYTLTRPDPLWDGLMGRIDDGFVVRHAAHVATAVFYVCGSSGMVNSLRDSLRRAGVDASRMRSEGFPGYESWTGVGDRVSLTAH